MKEEWLTKIMLDQLTVAGNWKILGVRYNIDVYYLLAFEEKITNLEWISKERIYSDE
jgi:hypothetical protein